MSDKQAPGFNVKEKKGQSLTFAIPLDTFQNWIRNRRDLTNIFKRTISMIFLLLYAIVSLQVIKAINNCPMPPVRAIIQRATNTSKDATTQMQMVRRILEDIYGGTWGVLIIKNPNLISQEIHWTIPDHVNSDGSPAFCLVVIDRWQYNIFKTGAQDRVDRLTVEDVVNKIRQNDDVKPRPRRLTIQELDKRLAWAIEQDKQRKRQNIIMDIEVLSRSSTPEEVNEESWKLKVSWPSKIILHHIYNAAVDQISCTRIVSPSGRYEFLHFTTKWLVQQGLSTTVYLFLDNRKKYIVEYSPPWNLIHRGTLGFYWMEDEAGTIIAVNKHKTRNTIILSQFKVSFDHRNRVILLKARRDYITRSPFEKLHVYCMQDFEKLETKVGDYCLCCIYDLFYLISYDAEIKLEPKGPIRSHTEWLEINGDSYKLKDPCREGIKRKDPKVQRAISSAFARDEVVEGRKARSKSKFGLRVIINRIVETIKKILRFFSQNSTYTESPYPY